MTRAKPHLAAESTPAAVEGRDHREREIAAVLGRYGLSWLAHAVGVEHLAVFAAAVPSRAPAEKRTPPEQLRLALEQLGPTFMKLGQLLSTRADLLSPAYVAELSKLQDLAPALSGEVVEKIVEGELGAPVGTVFATFEPFPLACASIGQAHRATLSDGTDVVVKVRRPNVVEDMDRDLQIIRNFAARASRHSKTASRYDVVGLAEEMANTMRAQLDYLREAQNAKRFQANFSEDEWVQIPRVFEDLTTSRVITLERIRGMKITDRSALAEAGLDPHALAERTALIIAKMVFDDGFFHADPHPGNFFVEESGQIGIIDFGMVGSLDDRLREQLGRLISAFLLRDSGRLTDILIELDTSDSEVDRTRLNEDVVRLLAPRGGRGTGEASLRRAIAGILGIIRRHRLRMPRDLSLLFTVLIEAEGVVGEVDPGFEFAEALSPYARRNILSGLNAGDLKRRLEEFGVDLAELAAVLPSRLNRITEAIDSGGLEVHLRSDELNALLVRSNRLSNRVAASVLIAAVINALALLTASRRRRQPWLDRKVAGAEGWLLARGHSRRRSN